MGVQEVFLRSLSFKAVPTWHVLGCQSSSHRPAVEAVLCDGGSCSFKGFSILQ